MYSLGIVLFFLASQRFPFQLARESSDKWFALFKSNPGAFWNNYAQHGFAFSEEFKELVTLMLESDPVMRITVPDIVGHPWLQGPYPDEEAVRLEFMQRREAIFQTRLPTTEQSPQQSSAGYLSCADTTEADFNYTDE